jgi:hypothetical protein
MVSQYASMFFLDKVLYRVVDFVVRNFKLQFANYIISWMGREVFNADPGTTRFREVLCSFVLFV